MAGRTDAEKVEVGKEAVRQVVRVEQVHVKRRVRPHHPDRDEERHHPPDVVRRDDSGVRELENDGHKERVLKLKPEEQGRKGRVSPWLCIRMRTAGSRRPALRVLQDGA